MGNCWYRWEPTVNRVSSNAKSGKTLIRSYELMDFDTNLVMFFALSFYDDYEEESLFSSSVCLFDHLWFYLCVFMSISGLLLVIFGPCLFNLLFF